MPILWFSTLNTSCENCIKVGRKFITYVLCAESIVSYSKKRNFINILIIVPSNPFIPCGFRSKSLIDCTL